MQFQNSVRNMGGGHYNHTLFWESMTPSGGGTPPQPLLDKINESFGSFDKFKEQFVAAGIGQFGSGWVWLVESKGKLEIVKTGNAETPLTAAMATDAPANATPTGGPATDAATLDGFFVVVWGGNG